MQLKNPFKFHAIIRLHKFCNDKKKKALLHQTQQFDGIIFKFQGFYSSEDLILTWKKKTWDYKEKEN